MCSVSLLDKFGIGQLNIEPNYLSTKGFENVKNKLLKVIIISLIVGVATLNTPIHVVPHELSCNLILGRLWIHAMNGVPSTLHKKIKHIYSNKVYTLDADPKPYSILPLEKHK